MARFQYAAVTADGVTVRGVTKADTAADATATLSERGLSVLETSEKTSILQFELTTKKVPRKEIMHFSRQMAVFLRAGIPVVQALDVLRSETGNKVLGRALDDMAKRLREGETFSACVAAHPEAFPDFYLGIVRSSELTGNLDIVLDQLAVYIERDMDARRKVSSALTYPAVVLVLSVVAVVVITTYVLPKFKTFFNSLNAKLPLPTRMLLSITNFLTNYWWVLVAGLAVLVTLGILGRKTARGRGITDSVMLKVPVVGAIIRYAVLERFCRILSSMVGAGVPLPEALAVTTDGTANTFFRTGLVKAREAMMRGEGLAAPLAQSGLFPPAARQMFRVGEDTGSLDEQLATSATYFDRELEFKIKRFTDLFEPAVVIFMGVVVGFVAIALISAMYGIFRQVHV